MTCQGSATACTDRGPTQQDNPAQGLEGCAGVNGRTVGLDVDTPAAALR